MKPIAIQTQLRGLSNPAIAERSVHFFKTGEGDYGEGDKFLGIRVSTIRALARRHEKRPMADILSLLLSPYHEERLLALVMMVNRFEKADEEQRRGLYKAYLGNTRHINSWDLVDSSAPQIVGGFLWGRKRQKLKTLSRSKSLWERRISIISTYFFIKKGQFDDTLAISKQLLNDKEDLIHKAVGWMLREVGNRDSVAEKKFLLEHYKSMPRTMLRYAIEKFKEQERKQYLNGEK